MFNYKTCRSSENPPKHVYTNRGYRYCKNYVARRWDDGTIVFSEMGRWDDRFSEMGRLLNIDGTMGRSGVKSWVGQWDDLDSRKGAIGTLWGGMGHSGVDDGTLWGGTIGHFGMGHFDKPNTGSWVGRVWARSCTGCRARHRHNHRPTPL